MRTGHDGTGCREIKKVGSTQIYTFGLVYAKLLWEQYRWGKAGSDHSARLMRQWNLAYRLPTNRVGHSIRIHILMVHNRIIEMDTIVDRKRKTSITVIVSNAKDLCLYATLRDVFGPLVHRALS